MTVKVPGSDGPPASIEEKAKQFKKGVESEEARRQKVGENKLEKSTNDRSSIVAIRRGMDTEMHVEQADGNDSSQNGGSVITKKNRKTNRRSKNINKGGGSKKSKYRTLNARKHRKKNRTLKK